MADLIHIEALAIASRIGVPAAERRLPQRLSVCATIEPDCNFVALNDRIDKTIDYAAVCEEIKAIAQARTRRLVETLAEDIATGLLAKFPIWRVIIEVRKFILPDTDYVAIRIERPVPRTTP